MWKSMETTTTSLAASLSPSIRLFVQSPLFQCYPEVEQPGKGLTFPLSGPA